MAVLENENERYPSSTFTSVALFVVVPYSLDHIMVLTFEFVGKSHFLPIIATEQYFAVVIVYHAVQGQSFQLLSLCIRMKS